MESLKLRFSGEGRRELPLDVGVHGIGPVDGGGIGHVEDAQGARVRLCVDRRGVWLAVAEGAGGVHVNGREVRRMAMLRVGDAIYVDGTEMRLVGAAPPPVPGRELEEAGTDAPADPRVVLRGVGGQYHGRSFTLDQPRLVGRAREADIRIDDPAFDERHARLELAGERIVLRDLGSAEGSTVNGEQVRDALLQPGDQVVFDAHHRFVVEAPMRAADRRDRASAAAAAAVEADAAADRPPASPWRLPWLLLAALAIAGLLAALLLFGAG